MNFADTSRNGPRRVAHSLIGRTSHGSTVASANYLEIFPLELLNEFRSHIPQTDLRTAVCFYCTCPQFAAAFKVGLGRQEPKFWRMSCLMSGLGRLPNEESYKIDWKGIAITSIMKDGFCDHPQCGASRLEQNGEHPTLHITRTS